MPVVTLSISILLMAGVVEMRDNLLGCNSRPDRQKSQGDRGAPRAARRQTTE